MPVHKNGANGVLESGTPSGEEKTPSVRVAMEERHAQHFQASTAGLGKRAAFALGRPVGDVHKMSAQELPTPLCQAVRVIERMLDEGKPEHVAIGEFEFAAQRLGRKTVPLKDWTPTFADLADAVGGTPETRAAIRSAFMQLYTAFDVARAPEFKRGKKAGRS